MSNCPASSSTAKKRRPDMKLLMLDAGPDPSSTTAVALREIRAQLDKEDVDSEVLYIGNDPDKCDMDAIVQTMIDKTSETDGFVTRLCHSWAAASKGSEPS